MLYFLLSNRSFMWALFIINLLGTIYGYIWYGPQLERTEPIFLPFVPDSPTASLFFTVALFGLLIGKQWGLVQALAVMTLFKYGIWAVVMNILTLIVTGDLSWLGWMLVASHFGMALQGLLYAPFFRMKPIHLVIAALWTVHNEIIDYVFMQYPVYSQLHLYIQEIGYFTFWLSILSIFITWFMCVRPTRTIW
ncbi:hypothetical protein B1B05_01970 [Domibacillus enclensis]|uniref:Uncharacterized membrane protein YpjA n=2 Tax=Domibacillus enclensis TaxID=1017273 RepID=A0A1N6P7E3_9BACI|nr:DUF1405 domain-containing protein [Domibacillus enclensis]OXS80263.1 hypothetical protein B1B05_01970 [Domibacillus enclensis]SIQ00187.1 Uncharacterized membrane protein YpjA [Domibacillus enclensis]